MRGEPKTWIAAGGWRRSPRDALVKTRAMTDGELTQMLVASGDPDADADLRTAAYESLLKVQEQMGKALAASTAAFAFGLLVHEGALSGFSTSGLELDRLSFAHAALVAMSATGFWFGTLFTRESYIRAWFLTLFQQGAPGRRAAMLLRYPSAFWPFQFMRGNRGYPLDVQPARSSYLDVAPVLVFVAIYALFAIGALALGVAVAMQVWASAYPTPLASKLTVVACALLNILAWTTPRFGDAKRSYVHYGLVNLLVRADDAARTRGQMRIARARWRMGLIDPATMPPPAPPPPDPAAPATPSPPRS